MKKRPGLAHLKKRHFAMDQPKDHSDPRIIEFEL